VTRTDLPRLLPARSEDLHGHLARFGSVPYRGTASALIPDIEASGLTGRGGAAFPVHRKLAAVAAARGRKAVIANGGTRQHADHPVSGLRRLPGLRDRDRDAATGTAQRGCRGPGLAGGRLPRLLAAGARRGRPHPGQPLARKFGAAAGAGVLAALPSDRCGLAETARVVSYLAAESAGQCGPCLNGLPRIAAALAELAGPRPRRQTRADVERWARQVVGRGACSHPDGTVRFVRSALRTFEPELARHERGHCLAATRQPFLPLPDAIPAHEDDWM